MKPKYYFPVFIVFVFFIGFIVNSCHLGREIIFLAPDVKDINKFPSNTIRASNDPFQFKEGVRLQLDTVLITTRDETKISLQELLDQGKTNSLLVIKDDEILFEWYNSKYNRKARMASFSLAKSFVGTLIGIAVKEKCIGSIDQPITDYIPELLENDLRFSDITIRHLLNMTDGIKIKGNPGNPFGDLAKLYYGKHQLKRLKKLKIEVSPDERWDYNNMNSTLLGIIISRSSGVSLSHYMETRFWQPMGMEYDATWTIDNKKDRIEKAFCCLGVSTVDYAKLGRLYMNYGYWEGEEILPQDWVISTICQDTCKPVENHYQLHWWPEMEDDGFFEANGHLGQYVFVKPFTNVIIVRNGTQRDKNVYWTDVLNEIAGKL